MHIWTGPRRRNGALDALALASAAAFAALLAFCAVGRAAEYTGFASPQPVTITGYSGSAMEPFLTADGEYLLFNTSNVAPSIPSLQLATRVDAQTFEYQGELEGSGVNEPGVLSGTPTTDRYGHLFFVSPRAYTETLSTIYEGEFASAKVTGVHLVQGISGERPGLVDFDVGASFDGSALYVSVGDFSSGSGPTGASIRLYDRSGERFVPDPTSASTLRTINAVAKLDYAAAISSDGLELFFTAASPTSGRGPAIYRAARRSVGKPFGRAERIAAISGFAEAPSISADGSTLYFHELVGSEYKIERVTRAPTPAPTVTSVTPSKGPAGGGSLVRVKGANLNPSTAVRFGSTEATSVLAKSAGEILAVAPPLSAGEVDVTVTTPAGNSLSSAADRFTSLPVVDGLSPGAGSTTGGEPVTVTGAGFAPGDGTTSFTFGTKPATSVSCESSTTCIADSPPHAPGIVDVKAIANGVTSPKNAPGDQFGYS